MIEWIILVAVGILGWIALSIKAIGPNEQAVLVILWKPVKRLGPGFRFVPRFFGCYVKKYPLKIYDLDYPAREVVTKAGNYGGKHYGAQVLKVDSVVYQKFPRNDRLISILQSGVPSDDKGLLDWTEEAVLAALRVAFSRMTWKEAIENIHKVRDDAEGVFKGSDGALIAAGFNPEDIKLAIVEIKLPPELEKTLPIVDQKRIESEGAKFDAKKRAVSVMGMVLESMAEVRGKTIKEIQKEINNDKELKKEFLKRVFDLLERQMAIDGNSFFDFRAPDSKGNVPSWIAETLALWKKMDLSGKPSEKPEEKKKKPEHIHVF